MDYSSSPYQVSHDLVNFMRSLTNEMSDEYYRIHKRASEDPGTAGDQGEENWANLLREWLPPTYQIVTKGQLISHSGKLSPQVDILVLQPYYPKYLLNKKHYLPSGVAAIFECKLTLRAADIRKVMQNCYKIQSLIAPRNGTPYKELYSPLVFGLLAHSHSWKGNTLEVIGKIYELLYESDLKYIKHPRQMLDIICVANLVTLSSWKHFNSPRDPKLPVSTLYSMNTYLDDIEVQRPTPIGDMITKLWKRLAWENPIIRDLAKYFSAIQGFGSKSGGGFGRNWPNTIFSDGTRELVEKHFHDKPTAWNEWFSLLGVFDSEM